MAFIITPDSYTFNNINESSTFSIVTDNEDYKFEFVNTTAAGSGRVSFDRNTKTMTAISYGKARYRFVDGTDVYYFNVNVLRPTADTTQALTQYVQLGTTSLINYTVPDGYYLKRYELDDLDTTTVSISTVDYRQQIVANSLGSAKLNIVLGKETLNTGDDTVDIENDTEYDGGSITIKVINYVMNPSSTTISLLLKQEYSVDELYLIANENNERGQLTFVETFDKTQHCFSLTTRIIQVNNQDAYALVITGLVAGTGTITVKYGDTTLKTLNVIVEDRKGLNIEPRISELKLGYLESYTFKDITFVDNNVLSTVNVETSADAPFKYELVESPADSKYYTLTITNRSPGGGNGVLTVKGATGYDDQLTIDITCYKEVKAGELVFEPSVKNIKIVKGQSYGFTFFYYTNADEVEAISGNTDYVTTTIGNITEIPKIPNPDDPKGEWIDRTLPDGAVVKTLFIIGKEIGNATVTVKTYLNDRRDVVNEVVFNISVLANDDLPDNIQLINLKTKPMKSGRKRDILIEFPDESGTLVLKEDLEEDSFLELGEGFDAISTTKPTATSNIELFNSELNRTYLYLDKNKDKGPDIYASTSPIIDDNSWRSAYTKEVVNEDIVYPNPGEKGFGVGPAPTSLSEAIGLKPYNGCWDPSSDNYGNYYDYLGNTYVFIPKHYIIPKADQNKAGKFPYFGMAYKFSWVETDEFPESTIPRCFINAGKVQPGIFVAKYNSGATTQSVKNRSRYEEINGSFYTSPRESSSSKPSVYKTTGSSDNTGPEYDYVHSESMAFPELEEMALTHKLDNSIIDSRGIVIPNLKQLHNMTIFIQTMIVNLGDCHTIASYEKGASDSVCGKLKNYIAGTLTKKLKNVVSTTKTSEVQMFDKMESSPLGTTYFLTRDMYRGSNTGDIVPEYRALFSHNGQACGVFDVNGGINVPLPGILIKQDPDNSDTYEIYALKDTVDIAEIDKATANTIEGINTENIVFSSAIFNLDNYDKVLDIVNDTEIKGMKYMNVNQPYITHNGENSLLINGTATDKLSINSGICFNSLTNNGEGNYAKTYQADNDYKTCVDKHKNSVFYLSALTDSSNIKNSKRTTYLSMFVCNYVENYTEAINGGYYSDQADFTGYRTRVLRLLGRLRYDRLNGSKYLFSRRHCITPNL